MKTSYELFDLGGNPTAVITQNVNKQGAIELALEIMKRYSFIEQVAIIERVDGDTCRFRMAGGEFCGNACRAVAEFMRKNRGFDRCQIIINGLLINGQSNGQTSQISIIQDKLCDEIVRNGRTFYSMRGITHTIVEGLGDELKAQAIKQEAAQQGISDEAFGVMFLEGNKMNPFVWVEKAKTFFNETACMSGSIATALFIGKPRVNLVQPTGQEYTISVDKGMIIASGSVEFLGGGEL